MSNNYEISPQQKIFNWQKFGHIYIWKVLNGSKSYKGSWNLYLDLMGKESFISLVKLMREVDGDTRKSISLTRPDKINVFSVDMGRVQTWDKLVMTKSTTDEICFREEEGKLFLFLGDDGLSRLINEIEKAFPQNESVVGHICGDNKQRLIIWW